MRDLNLTDQQKTQLKSLRETQRQQIEQVKQNSSLSEEQKREQIAQIRKQGKDQFTALLTPEQQAKLKTMREGREERGGSAKLNLTDQQKSQIKPILEQSREQMKAVRQDTSLTSEQKKEKAKQIREQTRAQILPLLTPEQQQQLQQMHQRRRKGAAAEGSGAK